MSTSIIETKTPGRKKLLFATKISFLKASKAKDYNHIATALDSLCTVNFYLRNKNNFFTQLKQVR